MLWGQRFEDILRFDTVDDLIHVDMNKFHRTLPDGIKEEDDEEMKVEEDEIVVV